MQLMVIIMFYCFNDVLFYNDEFFNGYFEEYITLSLNKIYLKYYINIVIYFFNVHKYI